jgi:hypothetical protein
VLLAAGCAVAAREVPDRHVAADQARLDDFPQRVDLEFVVGGEHELRILGIESIEAFAPLKS